MRLPVLQTTYDIPGAFRCRNTIYLELLLPFQGRISWIEADPLADVSEFPFYLPALPENSSCLTSIPAVLLRTQHSNLKAERGCDFPTASIVPPASAYRISGYYINKCDEALDPAHMLHYRNRALEELAGRVSEKLNKPRGSGYVERCRDYIQKHYREKIYLEDIAEALGISPTYLSRLFKKETGICLQDAINEERVFRAANLLLYSELSLTEIAQYVGFPNQSYMGKVFKKLRNMTPMSYRDRFKNLEVEV